MLIGSLGAVTAAHANKRHGTACQPAWGSASRIGYDERGAGNFDVTSTAELFCPLDDVTGLHWVADPYGNNAPPSVAAVWLYDNSTTSPAYCYIWATNEDSNSSWGPTRHTCATPGGCNGTTGGESATGYLQIEFADNTVDQPLSYFGEHYFDAFGVRCVLPPGASSSTRSFVKMIDSRWGYIASPF
ncbi:MAG TPA: hypothetical protein VK601_29885 [Kofleriaceae bacterium]|nr:hypothetical protein [Kofleriaceae bacterium]